MPRQDTTETPYNGWRVYRRPARPHEEAVLALLLYPGLGPRAALTELMAELLICLAVIGGGGATRVRRTLRGFLTRPRRRSPASA